MWREISILPSCLDTSKCYILVAKDGDLWLAKRGLYSWFLLIFDEKANSYLWVGSNCGEYKKIEFIKYRIATQSDVSRLKVDAKRRKKI